MSQQASSEIELSHLGLMALYSEIHPTISHIVHYGINMIAPVYKLQVTPPPHTTHTHLTICHMVYTIHVHHMVLTIYNYNSLKLLPAVSQHINRWSNFFLVQVTDEALILRRFPDERISVRLWNDQITHIERNKGRATVSVRYNHTYGEFAHHFHTKQVHSFCWLLIFECFAY